MLLSRRHIDFDRRGLDPRRQSVSTTAVLELVAGSLDLLQPVGGRLEVEVQLLLVEVRLAVLEGDLIGRVLGLRRHALALDARGLSRDLRTGLNRRARAEIGALRTVRAATPGAYRRPLSEDHRRDGQRNHRNRYDSCPPHVALSVC